MAKKDTQKKRGSETRSAGQGRSGRTGTERSPEREQRAEGRGAMGGEWQSGRGEERGMRRGAEGGVRQGDGGRQRGAMMRQRSPFQEIERTFGLPIGRFFSSPLLAGGLRGLEDMWPQTDVYREGNELVVKADLPGMKKDDVEVSIENGQLVVSGERRHESEVDEKDVYRSECSYGSFYRRVPLPEGADPEHAEARFRDGVLEVHVPLREKQGERGRRVEIR